MGNIQANSTKQVLSEYTSFINSQVSSVINQSVTNCTASNTANITTGGSDCIFELTNGSFTYVQNAYASCKLNSENSTQIQTVIQNTVSNNLQSFINQASKSTQDWFATAFSLQINDASNVIQVQNQMSNFVSSQIQNFCQSQILSANNNTVHLCGIFNGATINLGQNAFTEGVTSCVNKNVITAFTSNYALNQLWTQTDQKLASEQKGATSALMWIAIIGGIVLVVLIIGAILYFVLSSRSGGGGGAQIYTGGYPGAPPPQSSGGGGLRSDGRHAICPEQPPTASTLKFYMNLI